MIDHAARALALRLGTPEAVHIPVTAIDETAIITYIGDVMRVLSGGNSRTALLIAPRHLPQVDLDFPIWHHENSHILRSPMQVWVDISYTRYRAAYIRAFPNENLNDKVLSHARNRRVCGIKGFRYVRITPTTRAVNSSSAFSEEWAVKNYDTEHMRKVVKQRGAFIEYADLTDLMVMLDMQTGGGVMDSVNEGQNLIISTKK